MQPPMQAPFQLGLCAITWGCTHPICKPFFRRVCMQPKGVVHKSYISPFLEVWHGTPQELCAMPMEALSYGVYMQSPCKPLFTGFCATPIQDHFQRCYHAIIKGLPVTPIKAPFSEGFTCNSCVSPFSMGFVCNLHETHFSEGLHATAMQGPYVMGLHTIFVGVVHNPMQVPFQRGLYAIPWGCIQPPCRPLFKTVCA